jgi:transcriptional regulator with XRE-family HTH domain
MLHMAEMEYLPGGIRERMEDLRNRRKLTLKEVAEKTGIDYSTLSRIENGNVKKVGDDVLLKLARFFGVSTDFLLGITNVPDKKNYTIEELGLTPEAARNLYTGVIENRVINLLLVHPDFATLTNRIADYLDDRMAAGIAAQNQLYDSISELMMRIGKEEKALRQAATTQAKEAKALRRKLYADELTQIESLFKGVLSSIKKSAPPGKTEKAKVMTKEAFDHMVSELTRGGNVAEILKVKPEEITGLIAKSLAITNGASEEEQTLVAKTLLPFFPKGKTG